MPVNHARKQVASDNFCAFGELKALEKQNTRETVLEATCLRAWFTGANKNLLSSFSLLTSHFGTTTVAVAPAAVMVTSTGVASGGFWPGFLLCGDAKIR